MLTDSENATIISGVLIDFWISALSKLSLNARFPNQLLSDMAYARINTYSWFFALNLSAL